ncbi:hypothetical protein ILUMI_15143 [Ignelater luminosus]|uniref:Uncharacterized protein n=1 Tax=Ignelater luminosus TaxID=2038154 RepID=A0A8K0G456_IGNLU|nr:hypothetical protein ILUMI_15143 [Ignelater luminosus]
MPGSVASKCYGVPRITLFNKLRGIIPEECTMGPCTVLSAKVEEIIVTWLIDIARAKFAVTKKCPADTVQGKYDKPRRLWIIYCSGYFTTKREQKVWSDTWLDMIIGQLLM